MVSNDFRPPIFSPDERSWRTLCLGVCLGCVALIGWLASTDPEPSAWSSEAWAEASLPVQSPPVRPERHRASLSLEQTTRASRMDPLFKEAARAPLMEQLLEEAESGEVRPGLLLETFMEQEERHGGAEAPLLMSEFLDRSQLEVGYPDVIEQLAAQKAQMVADPELVYVSNAFEFTDVLVNDQLQCQSSTMIIALAWLQQEVTQRPGGPRPVLVMSSNHVQPGLLLEGTLHLMEATSRGNRVSDLQLAELKDARILDAADALTWTLLQDDTPDRIQDRMTLFSSHSGDWRFRPGSGAESWLHLPHSFGGPIALSSQSSTLRDDVEPATMLQPSREIFEQSPTPALDFRMILEPSVGIQERPLSCPCKQPGMPYPPLEDDPCRGQRQTLSGQHCDESKGIF
jgi:hypothetical protein